MLTTTVLAVLSAQTPAPQPSPTETEIVRTDPGTLINALKAGDWSAVGVSLAVIIAIVVASALTAHFARRGVRRYVSRATARGMARFADPARRTRAELRARTLGNVLSDVATGLIWIIAVFTALGQVGISLGPLIAGAGIAGLAIGFGAQSLVKDFFSGFFVLLEDQFGVGDVIWVNPDVSGIVEDISLRVTRLRSLDGTVWFVPNGDIRYLGNRSKEWSRALIDLNVAFGTDLDAATEAIRAASQRLRDDAEVGPKILEDVEILGVEQIGEAGVTIRCFIKTLPLEQWTVSRRFRAEVKGEFDSRRIELAVPHRRLVVEDGRGAALTPADGARSRADQETSPHEA